MFDYSALKLIKGSANTHPVEDPVLGANGTANVIRINNFIQRVQDDLTTMVPQGKGNLIIGAGTAPIELQVGPNNYCLTVDPTTPSGVLWEERVDMVSAQKVGGKKTFTSDLEALQDVQVGLDLGVGGNTSIVGNVSAHNGHLTGTLEVGGSTLLHSTITVANSTYLQSNLSVVGATMLNTAVLSSTLNVGGDVHMDSSLTVVGPTTMQSNLTLDGSADVSGSVMVGNDVLISDSLSVGGAANLSSLAVEGPASLTTTTTTDLTVTGNTSLKSLSITGALAVGTTLTTGGNITSGGNITTTQALTVGGVSTLAGVTSASMTTSGTTTTGRLVVLQGTNLNDTLWVGGTAQLRSSLSVVGGTALQGDLNVGGISTLGRTTTADLDVNGATNLHGPLSVDGTAYVNGDIAIEGSAFTEGSSTVEQDLTVGGRTVLAGPLTTLSIAAGSAVFTNSSITALTTGTTKAEDIEYTGALTGNKATVYTLSSHEVESTDITTTNLTVTGSATIPGLTGTNSGDEVEASPTLSGTVRVSGNQPDPIVYTVTDAQATFIAKGEQGVSLATLVGGKVPIAQLPPLAISETYVVASIADMNALMAQVGDVAVLTNPASTYILQTEPNGWVVLNTPTDAIPSVFNRVGPIQAQVGDYTASLISLAPIPTLNADNVQVGMVALVVAHNTHVGDTTNPHAVTAEQVEAIPTWEKGSGLGVATLDAQGRVPMDQLPADLWLGSTSRMVREFTVDDLIGGVLTLGHGLGEKYPSSVTVYSNLDRVIVPDDIEAVDNSTLRVYLTSYTNMLGTWKAVVSL